MVALLFFSLYTEEMESLQAGRPNSIRSINDLCGFLQLGSNSVGCLNVVQNDVDVPLKHLLLCNKTSQSRMPVSLAVPSCVK